MGIKKIESFLESNIEGFFNKRFASALEEAELVRGIEKELAGYSGKNATNEPASYYEFVLSPDDYQQLCSRRVIDALYATVEKLIILQGCTLSSKLNISCRADAAQSRGTYNLITHSAQGKTLPCNNIDSNTLVLEKNKFSGSPLNLPNEHKLVSLSVVEGLDEGAYLEFGERKIYIGRLAKNEFILTDTNASRLHAYISYEEHRHVLYDAGSTNGTMVNGARVERRVLENGDEIQIGETVLLYEVI